MEVWMYKSDL